jgi:hypothetical protein
MKKQTEKKKRSPPPPPLRKSLYQRSRNCVKVGMDDKIVDAIKLVLPKFEERKRYFVNLLGPARDWGFEVKCYLKKSEVYENEFEGQTNKSILVEFQNDNLADFLRPHQLLLQEACNVIIRDAVDDDRSCFMKLNQNYLSLQDTVLSRGSVATRQTPFHDNEFFTKREEMVEFTAVIEPGFWVDTAKDSGGTFFKVKQMIFE